MIYVPGELFSVNPPRHAASRPVRPQRARGLRVRDTAHGPFVMTLVGATIVGSMATVWHGVVNPPALPRARMAGQTS
jgi:phosphatidylserine decarboxylase